MVSKTNEIIPKEQIKNLFTNLLVIVNTIENLIEEVYQIDAKLAGKLFESKENLGYRNNIQMLQQNKEQNKVLIQGVKTKLQNLINDKGTQGSEEISKDTLKQVCDLYDQLVARVRNDDKYSTKIAEDIGENILEVQGLIEKLEKLRNGKAITDEELMKAFKDDVNKAIEVIKQESTLTFAQSTHYFYLHLKEAIIANNNDNAKIAIIKTNLQNIVNVGFQVIERERARDRDPNQIERIAKEAVDYARRTYQF